MPTTTTRKKRVDPLATYRARRDFGLTAEPDGAGAAPAADGALSYVVQKHDATRLHYDFRLEWGGVLLSWAVPKGPSYDPADKRMAIRTEDHPIGYRDFEGTIPPKQYGAGTVIVWDRGTWEPLGDPAAGLAEGKLAFALRGQKLAGLWELVRIAKPGDRQEAWLLFKKRGDGHERPRAEFDVVVEQPDSVIARPIDPPASAAMSAAVVAPGEADPPARKATRGGGGGGDGGGRSGGGGGKPVARPAIPGSRRARLPETLEPQLATLATDVPATGDWRCEVKFDGYRILCRVERGRARLITRGGHDWSDRMPGLVAEIERLGLRTAWLDGEIVVLDDQGRPSFNALQKSFDRRGSTADAVVYFVFDLPFVDGRDLRGAALADRRRALAALLEGRGGGVLRLSADFAGPPGAVLESACRMGLEGVIAKRADAPYVSRRADSWLKLKCRRRQEFVVCGYTDRSDGSPQIGSLILGVHDATGALRAVGSVGTGWDGTEARALKQRLVPLETGRVPFAGGEAKKPGRWSRRAPGAERWIEPTPVVEIEFAEVTPDGQVRHAVYRGWREDKPATSVTWEQATPPKETSRGGDAGTVAPPDATSTPRARASAKRVEPIRRVLDGTPRSAGVRISHGERVIDPSTGLTKLDLVRYYASVAEQILPHLVSRPCSLVRGPSGVDGPLFFQKHGDRTRIPGLRELDPALWPDHDALLEVATAEALAAAAQMNVIEFHTWNSTVRAIDRPDRIIFDLDPGEGTTWPTIQEAATLVRGFLEQLGLACWLKTSGGKGLHVVAPLAPRHDYDTVKGFSQAVVQHLARVLPDRFVAQSGPQNRVGRIFVDWIRNGHGATTAAAYSVRARPGLGVSMPVAWDDLPTLTGGAHWTIANARDHLSLRGADPWQDYRTTRQSLGRPMKALGYAPGKVGKSR